MKTLSLGLSLLLATWSIPSPAQDAEADCDGCKDHPMLARYPGTILFGADRKAFEEAVLPSGPSARNEAGDAQALRTIKVEGQRTRLFYIGAAERSALEVFANYRQALRTLGMSEIWSCSDADCGPEFASQSLEAMHLNLSNTPEASLGFTLAERPRYLLARLVRPQGDVTVRHRRIVARGQQRHRGRSGEESPRRADQALIEGQRAYCRSRYSRIFTDSNSSTLRFGSIR
jgi:hypothetical protein